MREVLKVVLLALLLFVLGFGPIFALIYAFSKGIVEGTIMFVCILIIFFLAYSKIQRGRKL